MINSSCSGTSKNFPIYYGLWAEFFLYKINFTKCNDVNTFTQINERLFPIKNSINSMINSSIKSLKICNIRYGPRLKTTGIVFKLALHAFFLSIVYDLNTV